MTDPAGAQAATPRARPDSAFARTAWIAALALVAVAAIAIVRELAIGRDEVGAATAAAARSDWPEAIAHARAAAEALTPGSPWPERGYRRLEAIGHDGEARGDDPTALLAYGAMRTAALATRTPGAANARWRGVAEEGLARVAADRKDAGDPRVVADAMRAALEKDDSPATTGLAVLGASVLGMLAGLTRLVLGAPQGRGRRIAQAVAVIGLGLYGVVMLTS